MGNRHREAQLVAQSRGRNIPDCSETRGDVSGVLQAPEEGGRRAPVLGKAWPTWSRATATEGSGTSKREPGEAGTGDASAAPRPAALTAPTGVPPLDQRHGHSQPPQPRERRDAGTPRSHHGRRRGSEESRRNPAARRPGPGAVPPAACHAHARPAPPPRGPMREREAETDGSGGQ